MRKAASGSPVTPAAETSGHDVHGSAGQQTRAIHPVRGYIPSDIFPSDNVLCQYSLRQHASVCNSAFS